MSKYRHRRSAAPATPFTNPLEPGEIAVNTANRQIAVGDAAAGTTGTPKPLLAIRYFDTAAQYVTNEFVVNGTALYRSNKATGPGAFVAADWQMMVGTIDPQYVAKAGDVMTGPLSLPAAAPTTGVQATNKSYVDALVALKASVLVSDVAPTPVPIDSTLWYCTLDGQLYIRYNDGNSTAWVIAAPQPDSSNYVNLIGASAVRYDVAQTLTAPQQVQARTNVYAAPFDALAYNGMQINGSMEVSQENGGATVSISAASNKYIVDGWRATMTQASGYYVQQQAGNILATGLSSRILISASGTAAFSPTGGSTINISQPIEGYRWTRLAWGNANAQPVTIGFWLNTTDTGVFTLNIKNSDSTRSYCTPLSTTSGVWKYHVVTIPGCTDGVWNVSNGVGATVRLVWGAGPTVTASSANTWIASDFIAAPTQTNLFSTTASNVYFSGFVVLPGVEAPSAARSPLIMRPYDQELVTCRRYFWSSQTLPGTSLCVAYMQTATVAVGIIRFPTPMRAATTPGITGSWGFNQTGGATALSSVAVSASSAEATVVYGNTAGSFGVGTAGRWEAVSNAIFTADARL